jgi:acetylornithine/succinyldiaminopimelate/putrescine aminotransferase
VHAGLWTTIELDLPATDVAKMARREGLMLTVTSDTSLLLCPPLNVTDSSLFEAIEPLRRILESIERETTSS